MVLEETEYFLNNNRIIYEKKGTNYIYYLYDTDELVGLKYNNNIYYYIKNLQGDIIGILNDNYEQIVSYEYDSWGKLLSIKDAIGNEISDTNHIGIINPFRYRGYYYDTETELYYLNSRYYNPEWRRFINADGLLGANQDIFSSNIYAYCSNSPNNKIDNNGNIAGALPYIGSGFGSSLAGAILSHPVTASIGWGVVGLFLVGSSIYYASKTKTASKPRAPIYKPEQPAENKKIYQLATVQGSQLIKHEKYFTFNEAVDLLESSNKILGYKNQYGHFWGIYTEKPSHATALAIAVWDPFQIPLAEIHNSGYYWHYHDRGHNYHIWFGEPIYW